MVICVYVRECTTTEEEAIYLRESMGGSGEKEGQK